MSEEEKEEYETAIANGKDIIKVFEFPEGSIAYYEIYSMINLIEKQQKEIEELQKQINMKKVMVKNMPKDVELILMYKNDFDRNFGSDYVSKDKIKQKIKELERLNKEQEIPVLKEYKFIRKEMIDYFKELIGEESERGKKDA